MFQDFSYYLVFGRPVILYLGILTLLGLIVTAGIPVLARKGIRPVPLTWHPWCAGATVVLAIVHGTLGVLAYY